MRFGQKYIFYFTHFYIFCKFHINNQIIKQLANKTLLKLVFKFYFNYIKKMLQRDSDFNEICKINNVLKDAIINE